MTKNIKQALNSAFRKVPIAQEDIDKFKEYLTEFLEKTNNKINESEEYHKNNLRDFFTQIFAIYNFKSYLNTKNKNDLVIHNDDNQNSPVGVIIETKKPNDKKEMITIRGDKINFNVKSLQQLLYYYLQERIKEKNINLKYLIVTDIYNWYIFDANLFERLFAENKQLIKEFTDFQEKRLTSQNQPLFYQEIASKYIEQKENELQDNYTYFNLQEYQNIESDRAAPLGDRLLIPLSKFLSPEHLLKLPFANDSNSLDKGFYDELLHIMGLTEVSNKSKKLIQRPTEKNRYQGSLLENIIYHLELYNKLSNLTNLDKFGTNYDEQIFGVALELVITWINRILFLKLLEAQLIDYNNDDKNFAFLHLKKITNFNDLDTLFFGVLAKRKVDRNSNIQPKLKDNIPYLNSSLFEVTELEKQTLFIGNLNIDNLNDNYQLPIFDKTVLKDNQGNKKTGKLNTLDYLFKFLSAYNFSSEGKEEIQAERKNLINASVLGLIFEKINGYQDGSYFTPSFITMYMCKETITRAVIAKFNQVKNWNCTDIEELENRIDYTDKEVRKEANDIINSIKICDPAVGSGHFLVSALNEIIALKRKLRILQDKKGKTIREYIEVENDELIIKDENGDLYSYKPNSADSQRLQETLFYEKKTIIENCLFGVDINLNSVNICRLRLWIELLKNAYYHPDTKELETLPNIDINIKCGNSLISRFDLTSDLSLALKKNNLTIADYQQAIKTYHNPQSIEEKEKIVKLIKQIKENFNTVMTGNTPLENKLREKENELYNLQNQTSLLAESEDDKKARETTEKSLKKEINKLKNDIEDEKNNVIYRNAFEWRFEFPEVLNKKGDFIGFDLIIGNPPYIRQEEFSALKPFLETKYKIYNGMADLLTYFVELAHNILGDKGVFQFIISNKFTRANYGKKMRNFLVSNTNLTHFIDFSGVAVFDEATVDACILGFVKKSAKNQDNYSNLLYANINNDPLVKENFNSYLATVKQDFLQTNLSENSWSFESQDVLKIKAKIEAQGIPLKDWDISISRGVVTGFNEAFIINGEKRQELINQDSKSADIIKPLLRGRDIQKYYPNFQDLYLITTFPTKKYNIDDFPAIKEYLLTFGKRLEQSGKKGSRKKTNNKWFETSDNIAYWQDFEKPKIIYPNMTKFLYFMIDLEDNYYHNDKSFHLVSDHIFWLVSFFNSNLFKYCFRDNFPELLGGTRELRKVFFEQISVKKVSNKEEKPFIKIVTEILAEKKANPQADTSELEREIDLLVYKLYGLTEEEIKIIEGG
jgi:type II restriction/modification system DNA methylase subunit YeeA